MIMNYEDTGIKFTEQLKKNDTIFKKDNIVDFGYVYNDYDALYYYFELSPVLEDGKHNGKFSLYIEESDDFTNKERYCQTFVGKLDVIIRMFNIFLPDILTQKLTD